MKSRKIGRSILSAVTAAALCAAVFPAIPDEKQQITAFAASDAVVDTTAEYQTIRGFGGINLPEWISQGDMTDAQRQKAFGNGDDELGFDILRIYVSDDPNAWQRAVPTALAAQKKGATIFATPWNPPASIRTSGGSNGKYTLPKSNYGAYAKHLNDYLKYMESQGVHVYAISVQNEPDYAEDWTYWSASDLASFIADYGKQVVAGTNTKLMSPESFQYRKDIYNAILNNSQAFANTDLFGTHFYGTQRSQMDFPALESCGKDIWMTEVYVPDSSSDADTWPQAVDVAENIHNGLVVANLNAYVWWYIRRSYGPMKENGNISKRGYCMAQYSKFVRPGDIRIDVTEQPASKVYVSAYKNEDAQVTIVAVNKSSSDVSQNFVLGSGETISEVDRYRTSANENLAFTNNLEAGANNFWAQLPANSVSTFIVSTQGEGKSPALVTDDDGYYFHDTFESGEGSWTGRGSASVAASNNSSFAGSSSLSCTGRAASWNGAAKELSTRTFIPGNEYSFSVNAMYTNGGSEETFKLTLQYTNSAGTAEYSNVATAVSSKGDWVQLANQNYKIPEGASNLILYVETEDSETSFYIDEAIGAPAGTVIKGAEGPKKVIPGDLDFDGKIDAFDTTLMRQGLIEGGYSSGSELKAADVNGDGKLDIADLVLHQQYILGDLKNWPEPETPPVPDNKWDDYQETASADWINFYKNSIKSMGNTYRLTSKLQAAESGQSLTVAYLGGSITEGKNYSSPFSNYVQQNFAKGSFKEVNAGLSGTSSVVGLVRCEDEVIKNNPDIIFLEFSVNDHEDIMYKKCFESLIKKCLSQPNEPAVIVLINRSKGGFSSQTQMAAAANNFNVPIISMDDALTKAFNSGFLSTGDYFTDEYHPHAKGGQLVADCLAYFFRQAMKTENRSASYSIPTTSAYGSEYANCVNVDPSTLTGFSAGSFTRANGYGKLPYSYNFQKNSANNPMTFKVNAKGFIVVFKANSSGMGNIVVTVNGKSTKISGNKQYTWGGPDAELGYYQDTAGDLDVSIKVENAGTDFTIQGIGLIK